MKTTLKQLRKAQSKLTTLEDLNDIIRTGGQGSSQYVEITIQIEHEAMSFNSEEDGMSPFLHAEATRVLRAVKENVSEQLEALGIELDDSVEPVDEPVIIKKKAKKRAKKKAKKKATKKPRKTMYDVEERYESND